MRIAQSLEVCTTAAHGDVERRPKKRWSDRGLQVIDLKAAGALSYMIGTDHTGSHTITVARTCMHHAPSRGCCQASAGSRRRKANRHDSGDRRQIHAARRWSTSSLNVSWPCGTAGAPCGLAEGRES